MEALLLMGIQASGKSSFARRYADTHVRLNLDMLRTRHREWLLFDACLRARARLIVDNTNVTVAERGRYLAAAKAAGFTVRGYYFSSVLAQCAERNGARVSPLPEVALRDALARLERPSLAEGFDELYYVRLASGDFVVEEYRDEVR